MSTPTNTPETPEVIPAGEGPDVASLPRADAKAVWQEFDKELAPLLEGAGKLVVTEKVSLVEMKMARAARLSIRDLRIRIEHARVELGEEALKRKKAIDTEARTYRERCEKAEQTLLEIEQFAERQEQKRIAELKEERDAVLVAVGADPAHFDSGKMEADAFEQLVSGMKLAKEEKARKEREEEEKRIAEEKAREEERARVAAENERLRKVAEAKQAELEKERQAREQERKAAEAEQKRLEAIREKERQAERDKAAEIERQAAEQRRRDAEAAEKERRRVAEAARIEREAAQAREAAERRKREAAEAEVKRIKAEEEAAKKKAEEERLAALAAPDKDKLTHFAAQIRAIQVPKLDTTSGKKKQSLIESKVAEFATWIETQAKAI